MLQKLLFLIFSFATLVCKSQNVDVQHYKFMLDLNDQNDRISGVAEIRLKFLKPVTEFDIDMVTQSRDGKGMKVIASGKELKEQIENPQSITLRLNGPATVGKEYTFLVSYSGIPADGLIISKNKFGDRTFFADNWPNRAHFWIPCFDHPDDKASFEFVVTAPSQYRVIANGVLVEQKAVGDGKTLTHWKEEIPLSTKVMVIGAARFAVKEFEQKPNGVPVSAWIYPQDSTKGFYDYALATNILQFFNGYIGPYPYKKLANVQSKTIFGGMENASTIFYTETSVKGDRSCEDLLAHEIAHQWFGDMASEKSFAHLWLSEGFATYLTNIYLEQVYGKEKLAGRMLEDRRDVIGFTNASSKPVVDSTKDLMSLLNANSYQKGGWVLHMLRNEVGDSVFKKIIQSYYQQYKGSNADSRDFEAVAEKVSGKELTWFFDQWLYRPGIPDLELTWKYDPAQGGVTMQVKQLTDRPYKFNLQFRLVYEDGSSDIRNWPMSSPTQIGTLPASSKVVKVEADPEVRLLYKTRK